VAYQRRPVPMRVPRAALRTFGDATPAAAGADFITTDNAKLAAGALCAFHGYRRSNGSILTALAWALLGKWKPLYVVPIALAQGVGRRKVWSTEEGPR
jgi:hypothetical protein